MFSQNANRQLQNHATIEIRRWQILTQNKTNTLQKYFKTFSIIQT